MKLRIIRVNIPSNRLSRAEVKRRPVYRQNFARRHALVAVLQKLIGVYLQHVRKGRAAAVQIKIAVVREVAERVPVALCVIRNHQRAVFYAVGHADRKRSGVALFHIGRNARKFHAVLQNLRVPDVLVESAQAAMQVVLSVVFRKRIRFAV